jgi:hypothetical protein
MRVFIVFLAKMFAVILIGLIMVGFNVEIWLIPISDNVLQLGEVSDFLAQ